MLLDKIQSYIKDNGPTSFKDIVIHFDYPMDRLANLYEGLLLDKRFYSLPNNVWDIKENYCYEEIHYEDIDDDEEEFEEEVEEEKTENEEDDY